MSFQTNLQIMKKSSIILLSLMITILSACSNQSKTTESKASTSSVITATGPEAIIYKTKDDYNLLVPVIMNAEKTEIVSYPAPGDLKYKGKLATPTVLADGFLLDNRGITKDVAFLNITYADYMVLDKTPSRDELMQMIIVKDPLLIMYKCGKRALYQDEVRELNAKILDKELDTFERVK